MRPIVLTIAGSDPSGGAGIQADVKAIEASGGFAAAAVTLVTAQNTRGVHRVATLKPDLVRDQLEAVFTDLDVVAVKSGALGSSSIVRRVAEALRRYRPAHYVIDPVVLASDGTRLLPAASVAVLRRELFPLATLVTPNTLEAGQLTGIDVCDRDSATRAGRRLLDEGCAGVLITGGHLRDETATDLLITSRGIRAFEADPVDTPHTHGTGCTFASAIATRLALGRPLESAVEDAKRFVTEALRHGLPAGGGHGPTDPFFFLHGASGR